MKNTISYHDSLIEALKNPEEASGYLNAVLEDGDMKMLLIALRNVAEARGGMVHLSRHTKLNRSNLYKVLSKRGSPSIHTLETILDALGLRLTVAPIKSPSIKRAA